MTDLTRMPLCRSKIILKVWPIWKVSFHFTKICLSCLESWCFKLSNKVNYVYLKLSFKKIFSRALNTIEIDDKVRADFHALYFPLVNMIQTYVKDKLKSQPWETLRSSIVKDCSKAVGQRYSCMVFLIMHDIFMHNATLGHAIKNELIENYTKTAFHTQALFYTYVQDTIWPNLQAIVKKYEIPCEKCFVGSLYVTGVTRYIDEYLCKDGSEKCQKSIREAFEFREHVQSYFTETIKYLGTLAAYKISGAPAPHVNKSLSQSHNFTAFF